MIERMRGSVLIRKATLDDAPGVWAVLEPILRAGETYALPRDIGRAEAIDYWCRAEHETFVADDRGEIVGTYFLRANQLGGGDQDRKSTRLNSSHTVISYAVFG